LVFNLSLRAMKEVTKQISNKEYIDLLKHDKSSFIIASGEIIHKIIGYFVKAGFLKRDEINDLFQDINCRLIEDYDKILVQYQGLSMLSTYIYTIITNYCKEIIRANKKITTVEIENIRLIAHNKSPENELAIKSELQKLDRFFEMCFRKKDKLELLLKIKCRVNLECDEILSKFQEISPTDVEKILNIHQARQNSFLTDKEIYPLLNNIFNKLENKNNSDDSIRKWMDTKIDEIIVFMNGEPPIAKYNRETIMILLEIFFQKKSI